MTDFLLLLGKLNLALSAAIVAVYLLRRPLRTLFGAPIAYAAWLLVPIMGFAVLLPPRIVAAPPAHLVPAQLTFAPIAIRQIPHPLARVAEQFAEQGLSSHLLVGVRAAAPDFHGADYTTLFFAGWVLGTVLMTLYLAHLQARFQAATRLGKAGPAVVGFFRPRIVIPDSFQDQFTPQEQAAILAHEGVHMARQDARINAFAALVRCLCWFNPLVHLGTSLLRADQELACDATTIGGAVSRRHYANALVKSQMMAAVLPLGCNWRGSQHPLVERIALLKCKRPTVARRITGVGIVMLATASAGVTAWAAQPPVVAKPATGPALERQVALYKAPVMVIAPERQDIGGAVSAQPLSNPTPANLTLPPRHISRQPNLVARPTDLLRLAREALLVPQLMAINDPVPTPPPPASDAPPAAPSASQTCGLPKIADTAPLEPLPGSDLKTVPVVVNGATRQFLLDLGLNKPTEVSPKAMAELGLPENPKLGQTMGGLTNVPVYDVRDNLGAASLDTRVRIRSFGVGGATDHNRQLLVTKKGEIGRSAPYDGFLTGDFFKQYDVELDFADGQMTWLTPTPCTDPNQVVFWKHTMVAIMPVGLAADGRLQMQAMVQGHLINAEIDTGSPQTVMRRDIAELYVGLKPDKDMTPVEGLKDGMGMQIYASIFPQIIFAGGGITALNVPVLIQDYSMRPALSREFITGHRDTAERIPDLVIGMDVLQHLHMYVVPRQGRVYATAAE